MNNYDAWDASDFNPRSREGSDGSGTNKWLLSVNFNPRSREGSDCYLLRMQYAPVISIHAPAKGATSRYQNHLLHLHISIHAPAKGATILPGPLIAPLADFNPRSREGSDVSS